MKDSVMTTATQPITGAEEVIWDLSDLYNAPDDPQIETDMQSITEQADAFDKAYRGRVAQLSAAELNTALQEAEAIFAKLSRLDSYATLAWTTDTQNVVWGKLLAKIQEFSARIQQTILFFQIEWINLPDDAAQALLDNPSVAGYQHYLRTERLLKDYTLSEPEEKILNELSITGRDGWGRYFGEVMSNLRYPWEGSEITQSALLHKLRDADRDVRQKATDVMTEVLKENLHTTTFVFNMMLADKASRDRLRGYQSWLTSRNIANQIEDEAVDALVDAVTSRYDLVWRYYRIMQNLTGYQALYDYDRYMPYGDGDKEIQWNDAQDIVLNAFGGFDQEMADIAGQFFEKNWIHATVRPGKRGGAYSSSTSAEVHPYIFMNYNGNTDSVMTLAHELGHGVHQYLGRKQGEFQQSTPLTTAEMASTFGEMLVFDYLIDQEKDADLRLSLRLAKIVDTFGTVFRQVTMNRFEDAIHKARRVEGELSTEQLSEHWIETQRKMHGDSVILREDYAYWWSYVPHFINVPGYVYAYAFGELLVWALYARYKQSSNGFAERYMAALSAGGSDWPHEILKPLDVNLNDPKFWHEGLGMLENFITETEAEANGR